MGNFSNLKNLDLISGFSGIRFTTNNVGRGFVNGGGQWGFVGPSSQKPLGEFSNVLLGINNLTLGVTGWVCAEGFSVRKLNYGTINTLDLLTTGSKSTITSNGDPDGLLISSSVGKKIYLYDQVGIGKQKVVKGAALTVSGGVFIGTNGFTANYDISSKTNKYLLWVQNGVVSENFALVKVSDWSDHVFSPDYSLRPLKEVQHFITKNNHLPDVPSEKEIVEKGYNIHEMNKVFMQKIEELTLYVIQQQKEIDYLKEQLNEQKQEKP